MSETTPFPATMGGYHFDVCPFLGLAEDPQTSMSFPSPGNFCHRTRPYGTPNLDFQRSFCFSENHSNCSIFTRSGRAALPAGIRFQPDKSQAIKRANLLLWIAGLVLLLGVLGVFWWIRVRANLGGGLSGSPGSVSPSASMQPLSTDTFHLTDTPVPATNETGTPPPSSLTPSPTLTLPPTLETPSFTSTFTPTPSTTIHFIPSLTPTHTFVIPPQKPVPPIHTAVPPTHTAVPPTRTSAPRTATPVPPTKAPTVAPTS